MTTVFSSPFGSPEDQLTNAEFARMLGNSNVQELYRDINLQALQDALDCSIAFHGVGIIFSDGQNSYLVRPTKHTGYSTSSQVTHVVITKTVAHTSRTAATNTLSEALTKPNVSKELASAALRLTESIIRAENPGISNQVLKQMVNAGLYPKRYPTEALQNGLRQQLRSALNNSMAFVGSGISGTLSSPINVKETGQYFVGIMQKLPQMVR